jgi:hypothetical protein
MPEAEAILAPADHGISGLLVRGEFRFETSAKVIFGCSSGLRPL